MFCTPIRRAAGYSATDFNDLFSAAFAQTLAFGLLLVREGIGHPAGPDAWRHMPEEHPLMRTALRVPSLEEVVHDVGIGFIVMCDTVNSFAPEILGARSISLIRWQSPMPPHPLARSVSSRKESRTSGVKRTGSRLSSRSSRLPAIRPIAD